MLDDWVLDGQEEDLYKGVKKERGFLFRVYSFMVLAEKDERVSGCRSQGAGGKGKAGIGCGVWVIGIGRLQVPSYRVQVSVRQAGEKRWG